MGLISSLKKAFSKPYKTVSVAEAKELLASGAALIDVRTAQEWRSGCAPQARHVPLDRLQSSTAGIQKSRPVIAVCASGSDPLPPRNCSPGKGMRLTPSAAAWAPGARPANRSARTKESKHSKEKPMAEISVTETDQRRSSSRILDVREDFEVAEGMIPGALHIPVVQLQARLSELDPPFP